MTPTTAPAPTPPAKPRRRRPGRSVRLSGVPWEMYTKLLRAFGDKGGVRLAYDRGELEITTLSFEHEADADALVEMIGVLTRDLGLPKVSGGSVTMKRKRWQKGLEPDRCYWIANAPALVGVRKLDLKIHPPPDLAVEVDVTRKSLNRFPIYAKLGVGELWRLDGDDLRFHLLGAKGRYVETPASRAFPMVTPADLMAFVRLGRTVRDLNAIARDFQLWLRPRLAPPPPPAP